MRKLLCEVLSFTLLPDQIQDLRREFEKMDTDGSGEISLAGLKHVLMENAGAGSLGALTEEEVEDIFNAMRVRKTETRIHWHEVRNDMLWLVLEWSCDLYMLSPMLMLLDVSSVFFWFSSLPPGSVIARSTSAT